RGRVVVQPLAGTVHLQIAKSADNAGTDVLPTVPTVEARTGFLYKRPAAGAARCRWGLAGRASVHVGPCLPACVRFQKQWLAGQPHADKLLRTGLPSLPR